MLTGLLYNKPKDHLQFLGDCINAAKSTENIKWDTFLGKKPLPPISKVNDGPIRSESFGFSDEPVIPTFETEPILEMKLKTKLPSIGQDRENKSSDLDNVDEIMIDNDNDVEDFIEKEAFLHKMALEKEAGSFKNQTIIFVLGMITISNFYFICCCFSLDYLRD